MRAAGPGNLARRAAGGNGTIDPKHSSLLISGPASALCAGWP